MQAVGYLLSRYGQWEVSRGLMNGNLGQCRFRFPCTTQELFCLLLGLLGDSDVRIWKARTAPGKAKGQRLAGPLLRSAGPIDESGTYVSSGSIGDTVVFVVNMSASAKLRGECWPSL